MPITIAAAVWHGHSSARMRARSGTPKPLTETEFEDFADLLDLHGLLDIDGVLGLLHAVAVAPGIISPTAWIPLVLSNAPDLPDQEGAQELIEPLLRLHNDVLDALKAQQAMMPDADDQSRCESFASGYAAGAELDPLWTDDSSFWTFAAPIAFLGGRLDLVPADLLAKIESMPEPKSALCRQMGPIIATTEATFRRARQAMLAEIASRNMSPSARVGRNDPCPCGSGKKYKRCCIDRPQPDPER